jgi:hypothetical protein
MTRTACLALVATLLAACGSKEGGGGSGAGAVGDSSPLLLAHDLEEAVPVLDALKREPGTEVAVVGRLRDYEEGLAALMLTDDSIAYCGGPGCSQGPGGCKKPWDYCCRPSEAVAGSLPVEMRDARGKVVETDALGLRLLDLVAVKGVLEKTEGGGLVLVTREGWFRRSRPDLPDDLHWHEH